MKRGIDAVAAGRGLIGTRFVAQGRDAARGLDCIGLAINAYDLPPAAIVDDYRMAGEHRPAILLAMSRWFRRVSRRRLRAGDLLLCRPGARQFHLMIWTGEGVIHADARRRVVIERPGVPEWPVAAAFRARVRPTRGN